MREWGRFEKIEMEEREGGRDGFDGGGVWVGYWWGLDWKGELEFWVDEG